MRKAFTLMEEIIVIFIIGILAIVAVPRYFKLSRQTHEAVLVSFVNTLNRTIGEELWAISMSQGKNGSIKNLADIEDAAFLSKYVEIPEEINSSSVNLSNCGENEFKTVMTINSKMVGEEYNITCKDGSATTAPFFQLIRIKDNKTLVSR